MVGNRWTLCNQVGGCLEAGCRHIGGRFDVGRRVCLAALRELLESRVAEYCLPADHNNILAAQGKAASSFGAGPMAGVVGHRPRRQLIPHDPGVWIGSVFLYVAGTQEMACVR